MNYLETLVEFQNLGCKDQAKVGLACRVYMNLVQKKVIKKLEKCYHPELDLIYLRGEEIRKTVIFLPFLHTEAFNMLTIGRLQMEVSNDKSIMLAICDTSSNILYYKMTAGIKERTPETNITTTATESKTITEN